MLTPRCLSVVQTAGRKGKLGDGIPFSLPCASSASIKDSAHIKRRNENPDKGSQHQCWWSSQHFRVPGTGLGSTGVNS